VAQWVSDLSPDVAASRLQTAGVPAGAMRRLPELLDDPQLTERGAYARLDHDLLRAALPAARRVAHYRQIPDPPMRQAPLAGQQSREICADVLGLGDGEVDQLVRAGVVQVTDTDPALAAGAAPSAAG
jgi:crotonobetainyl-CoA:carnitine CoA-transferase CaiB-like acyl-CoA transferase